jgi:Na+:H+ antiporter, NhaA family
MSYKLKEWLPLHWRQTPLVRVFGPLDEFIHKSTSTGIVLLITTVIALLIANSPLADEYDHFLNTEVGFIFGSFEFHESVLHWINDGLMAIFFLLVGLEIKRELLVGELSNIRAALLPICAAIGGSVVPAAIYLVFNANGTGIDGWGIPMATDIAFSLGLLALLGTRVPLSLKIFLTAVAIVDDLLAVLVIAFFYSSGINFTMLGIGFTLLAVLLVANVLGIQNLPFYIIVGIFIWAAFLQSGVHATIAGVLVAWTIPARNRIDLPTFLGRSRLILERLDDSEHVPSLMLTGEIHQAALIELEEITEEVQAPLQKLEHKLHNPVAFFVMPLFAFANAGVVLSLESITGGGFSISIGIILGLVLGKPLGILLFLWLISRAGIASLPPGIRWSHMVGVACLAGVGFTMSLFVASLAFRNDPALQTAKMGILIASLIAGSIGFFLLYRASSQIVQPETQ